MASASALIDAHGRTIRYLRISVTDRCDLRCRYCMAETMQFLPRERLMSADEIASLAECFIARGVHKIRLSGGEPLMRGDTVALAERLGSRLGNGLDELTMTTNATRLARHAGALAAAGIRRINVSLDSRDPDTFRHITRTGDLARVLDGIEAARAAGIAIKINMVALKGLNEHEIAPMLAWCGEQGFDLSLIETMPLGVIDEDRTDRFLPLPGVFEALSSRFSLVRDSFRTAGPARYWQLTGTSTRLGLISPLTANFCDGCNRVRLTTEGLLYLCLGQDAHVDLRAALRDGGPPAVDAAIEAAMARKPAAHDFRIAPGAAPAVARHMSVTGG
ncbi:GTP 3',8-cyclase MoaA [Sphingomonas desiccabilis]|uniref:GTP 3',8-cyclase n=1 Tax=Sphingomonas desiccabilis TaxID=429134 RepID=A0A4Q2IZB7_9SPHN|nr:GTP 3',8-cyclase MoaA [Sphingomonas desiccabilis]MBB3909935.1 cyclic pyranopterin phosphate synthase [Sphingomonas desiccabilis]RXZ34604.1 GTP 3',8-cyclase MoaA [Sphingomonas desiccabilis]